MNPIAIPNTCRNLDTIASSPMVHQAYQLAATNAAYILREIAAALGDNATPINYERLNIALSGIAGHTITVDGPK